MTPTKKQIENQLAFVMDPEMNISIVDLGLIYEININKKNNNVHIVMTLTSLGCPLFPVIEKDMKQRLYMLGYTEDTIEIELVFDPPWSMDNLSESAKAILGI